MKNQEDRRSLYSHSATAAPRFHEDDSSSSNNQMIGQQDLESGGLLHDSQMQRFAPRQSSYYSARAEVSVCSRIPQRCLRRSKKQNSGFFNYECLFCSGC